jgi:hypothetical protein
MLSTGAARPEGQQVDDFVHLTFSHFAGTLRKGRATVEAPVSAGSRYQRTLPAHRAIHDVRDIAVSRRKGDLLLVDQLGEKARLVVQNGDESDSLSSPGEGNVEQPTLLGMGEVFTLWHRQLENWVVYSFARERPFVARESRNYDVVGLKTFRCVNCQE